MTLLPTCPQKPRAAKRHVMTPTAHPSPHHTPTSSPRPSEEGGETPTSLLLQYTVVPAVRYYVIVVNLLLCLMYESGFTIGVHTGENMLALPMALGFQALTGVLERTSVDKRGLPQRRVLLG